MDWFFELASRFVLGATLSTVGAALLGWIAIRFADE
jgi:hypothetical protein